MIGKRTSVLPVRIMARKDHIHARLADGETIERETKMIGLQVAKRLKGDTIHERLEEFREIMRVLSFEPMARERLGLTYSEPDEFEKQIPAGPTKADNGASKNPGAQKAQARYRKIMQDAANNDPLAKARLRLKYMREQLNQCSTREARERNMIKIEEQARLVEVVKEEARDRRLKAN